MRILLLPLLALPALMMPGGSLAAPDDTDPPVAPVTRFEDLDAPDDEPSERQAPDAAQLLARGNRTLAVRGPEAALLIFRDAVAWHPDNAELRTQLAFCQIQTGDTAGALAQVEAILSAHPDHAEARWYRALAWYESGELRRAAAGFTDVLGDLEAGTAQVPKAHWYRASALEKLLLDPAAASDPKERGLTQPEVDQLLASYDAYIELDAGAVDWPEVARKAAWVRQNRPKKSVKRWVAVRPTGPRGDKK